MIGLDIVENQKATATDIPIVSIYVSFNDVSKWMVCKYYVFKCKFCEQLNIGKHVFVNTQSLCCAVNALSLKLRNAYCSFVMYSVLRN